MTERIYTSELRSELRYKDYRSVRRWCKNNGVRLLSDIGCRKQYVLLSEYENAKLRNYSKSNEMQNSATNFHPQYHKAIEKTETEYQPQFDNEKRMLSILLNI